MGSLALSAIEHVTRARYHFDRSESALADAASAYWLGGRELLAAKESAAHGEWLPLLEAEGISERTAQRAMRLASEYSDPQAVIAAGGALKALDAVANPTALSDLETATVADVPAGIDRHRWRRFTIPGYDQWVAGALAWGEDNGKPSPELADYEAPSSAEAAACVAFWTGRDAPRLDPMVWPG